tara:strand:- start:1219 stop:1761 length:543 start_codon:yes stop_codon:yes gene_type:complete
MKIEKTSIKDLYIIEPEIFFDSRGYFFESFNSKSYNEILDGVNFVQDNFSKSTKGVLRGLHFQRNNPQGKLVQVTKGLVFDVAIDLRFNSKTFGQWHGVELSEENKKQFWIPEGFAHGFQVLSNEAHFQYKCTNFYDPHDDNTLLWSDPSLDIKWKNQKKILSDKDKNGCLLNSIAPIKI